MREFEPAPKELVVVEVGTVLVGCVLGLQGVVMQVACGPSNRSDQGGSMMGVSDLVESCPGATAW